MTGHSSLHVSLVTPGRKVLWETAIAYSDEEDKYVASHMGSTESSITELTGLSLGDFRGRLRRLGKRLKGPAAERLQDLCDALPKSSDVSKKLTVVKLEHVQGGSHE